MTQEPDRKRFPIFLTAEERRELQIAAAYNGMPLWRSIVTAALNDARRVIAEQQRNSQDEQPSTPI